MPVLIVVIAAYLFFFAVISLIALAEYADARERRRRGTAEVEPWPMAGFNVAQAFQPVYARFWEAQVPVLLVVRAGGRAGVPVSRLNSSFRRIAARFPELLDGCSLDQWIGFLEREQLVACRTERVAITPQGLQFLAHGFTTGAAVNS
jgi:hypothetical protein